MDRDDTIRYRLELDVLERDETLGNARAIELLRSEFALALNASCLMAMSAEDIHVGAIWRSTPQEGAARYAVELLLEERAPSMTDVQVAELLTREFQQAQNASHFLRIAREDFSVTLTARERAASHETGHALAELVAGRSRAGGEHTACAGADVRTRFEGSSQISRGSTDADRMNARKHDFSSPTAVMGAAREQQRHRLLYIEDNQSNLTLVEWILDREADVELISAMGGRRGLELAHEHQPDLIVLDLHLPDMPGHQVLQCLQGDAATCRIPVVVLSADASEKQIKRLLGMGARNYLTKPLDIPHFLDVIAANLSTRI